MMTGLCWITAVQQGSPPDARSWRQRWRGWRRAPGRAARTVHKTAPAHGETPSSSSSPGGRQNVLIRAKAKPSQDRRAEEHESVPPPSNGGPDREPDQPPQKRGCGWDRRRIGGEAPGPGSDTACSPTTWSRWRPHNPVTRGLRIPGNRGSAFSPPKLTSRLVTFSGRKLHKRHLKRFSESRDNCMCACTGLERIREHDDDVGVHAVNASAAEHPGAAATVHRADGSPIGCCWSMTNQLTNLVKMALHCEGWDVEVAHDGQEAIAKFDRSAPMCWSRHHASRRGRVGNHDGSRIRRLHPRCSSPRAIP